jgi:hypothetical protein
VGVVLALSLSGASELTAYATLGLAVLTVIVAIAAAVGIRNASGQLREARKGSAQAQQMIERQIDATRQPLLIDVPPDGPIDPNERLIPGRPQPRVQIRFGDGVEVESDPRLICVERLGSRLYIAVPFRNVGTGVAVLNPMFGVLIQSEQVPETSYARAERRIVPPGENTRITCIGGIWEEPEAYPWTVAIGVVYHDLIDRQESVTTAYLEQTSADAPWVLRDIERYMADVPDTLDRFVGDRFGVSFRPL